MYGAQALRTKSELLFLFENDVEMYGAQASDPLPAVVNSLRMM